MSEGGMVQVVTAVSSREEADRLAELAVERRLAACVQVSGPVASIYRWRGEVEGEREWLCTMKTSVLYADELMAVLEEEHPYETPEIICISVDRVSEGYLEWLRSEVG